MADLSDVEAALASAVTSALYPMGLTSACAVGSGASVYRGWPTTAALSTDLADGAVNVSVSPVADTGKNTTRWGNHSWARPASPGLNVDVFKNAAIFSGSPNVGDLAGVLAGGKAYVYQCRMGDSASLVAGALFGLIRADQVCQLHGSSLLLPNVPSVVARVAGLQETTTEVGRQEQQFRLAVWAATPNTRDVACSVIGAQLAQISFLALPDGSGGRLRYHATASVDDAQDAGVYRRDLIYQVEYATTIAQMSPSMLFGDSVCNGVVRFG